MKKTILGDWHKAHGATMVPFGGWEMPVSYTSLSEEHKAVRNSAGLFDISHMGQVMVRGAGALAFLQKATTNDVSVLEPGRMQYSLLPNAQGGLVDDIIVGRMDDSSGYFVVVNAGNCDADLAHMKELAKGFEVQVEHLASHAMFALQGPKAEEILQGLTSKKLGDLRYYWLCRAEVAGVSVILSRTGYTGEDGFEICLRGDDAPKVWEAILGAGKALNLGPIGLGARNTLRLEAAYPLYGHEIDAQGNPLEARLGWVIKPAKGDFVGKDKIEAGRGRLTRQLVGFEMQGGPPARDGYPVVDASGSKIGTVCSASPSPTLGKNIGLAYVPLALSAPGSEISIEIRGKAAKAVVVKTPFVAPKVKKNI